MRGATLFRMVIVRKLDGRTQSRTAGRDPALAQTGALHDTGPLRCAKRSSPISVWCGGQSAGRRGQPVSRVEKPNSRRHEDETLYCQLPERLMARLFNVPLFAVLPGKSRLSLREKKIEVEDASKSRYWEQPEFHCVEPAG